MSSLSLLSALLATSSGLALVLALWLRRRGGGPAPSRRAVATGVAVVALAWADGAFTLSAAAPRAPWLVAGLHSLIFAAPPLLYLGVVGLVRGAPGSAMPRAFHFTPVLVSLVSFVPWFAAPAEAKALHLASLAASWPPRLEFTRLAMLILLLSQSAWYAAQSAHVVQPRLAAGGDGPEIRRLRGMERFLRRFPIACAATAGLLLAVQALGGHRPGLVMAVFAVAGLPLFVLAAVLLRLPASTREGIALEARPLYRKSGLPQGASDRLVQRLRDVVENERPWLDPAFALTPLAARLGVSAHQLSQLLNQELGLSFTEFAKRVRVREACRMLADPRSRDRTMLAVALESGFGSKASFNDAFRRQTGMTPSEWRKACLAGRIAPETCPYPWDRDDANPD